MDFETLTNYTNKKYKKLKNNAYFSYSVHGFTHLISGEQSPTQKGLDPHLLCLSDVDEPTLESALLSEQAKHADSPQLVEELFLPEPPHHWVD